MNSCTWCVSALLKLKDEWNSANIFFLSKVICHSIALPSYYFRIRNCHLHFGMRGKKRLRERKFTAFSHIVVKISSFCRKLDWIFEAEVNNKVIKADTYYFRFQALLLLAAVTFTRFFFFFFPFLIVDLLLLDIVRLKKYKNLFDMGSIASYV